MTHKPFCAYRRLYIVLLFICLTNSLTYAYSVTDANNLHTTLFTGYNALVLPEYPITVQAEYNLLTINLLDIKSQTLSTSGWFTVLWNDSRLAWTKSSHGNIEHIYAYQTSVWHPELIVQNSIVDLTNLGEDDTQLRIQYDGEVRWEPAAILTTSCDMDVTYFPYDLQTCDIELASWGFHTDAVNLTFYKTNINLEDYRTNGEWDLVSSTQYTSQLTEDGLNYDELIFSVTLERLPGHYIMSVIFPVILTSVLTAVTFVLPVESGEKVGYILTVLLALAVLLTLFADNMPTTSKHTSVLVVFLTVTLGLASIVIIITILIIRLYHKPEEHTLPKWVYKMARKLKSCKCKSGSVGNINTEITTDSNQNGGKSAIKDSYLVNTETMYTNVEMAKFFDNLFFVTFVVLYILVVLCFTITLSVAEV